MWKNIIKPTLSLVVISVAVCLAVTAGYHLIKPAEVTGMSSAARDEAKAMLKTDTVEDIENEGFSEDVLGVVKADTGYAVNILAHGYTKETLIEMLVCFDPDGKVLGVRILKHAETKPSPTKENYLKQFTGKQAPVSARADGGEIDTIAGATVTSGAVITGVNDAYEAYVLASGNKTAEEDPEDLAKKALPDGDAFEALEDTYGAGAAYLPKNKAGIVFEVSEPGYYGKDIVLLVGFDKTGKIAGIHVVKHRETKGYGSQVLEQDNLDKYTGLKTSDEVNGVDNIAGATISSEAFKVAVGKAVSSFEQAKGLLS